MWTADGRKNAGRRVPIFLRLSGVWCKVKAEDRSLLCLLQLRISTMPTHSDRISMLFLKSGRLPLATLVVAFPFFLARVGHKART